VSFAPVANSFFSEGDKLIKFATGVVDTGGKSEYLITHVNDTGGK
jgi:hypothetical protein